MKTHDISEEWLKTARAVVDCLQPSRVPVAPRAIRKIASAEHLFTGYLSPKALPAVARERGIRVTGSEEEASVFLRGMAITAIELARRDLVRCDGREEWAARLAYYGYPELGQGWLWRREEPLLTPCEAWVLEREYSRTTSSPGVTE